MASGLRRARIQATAAPDVSDIYRKNAIDINELVKKNYEFKEPITHDKIKKHFIDEYSNTYGNFFIFLNKDVKKIDEIMGELEKNKSNIIFFIRNDFDLFEQALIGYDKEHKIIKHLLQESTDESKISNLYELLNNLLIFYNNITKIFKYYEYIWKLYMQLSNECSKLVLNIVKNVDYDNQKNTILDSASEAILNTIIDILSYDSEINDPNPDTVFHKISTKIISRNTKKNTNNKNNNNKNNNFVLVSRKSSIKNTRNSRNSRNTRNNTKKSGLRRHKAFVGMRTDTKILMELLFDVDNYISSRIKAYGEIAEKSIPTYILKNHPTLITKLKKFIEDNKSKKTKINFIDYNELFQVIQDIYTETKETYNGIYDDLLQKYKDTEKKHNANEDKQDLEKILKTILENISIILYNNNILSLLITKVENPNISNVIDNLSENNKEIYSILFKYKKLMKHILLKLIKHYNTTHRGISNADSYHDSLIKYFKSTYLSY